jgi:hypothetical protein
MTLTSKEYTKKYNSSAHGRANKLFNAAKRRCSKSNGIVSISQQWIEEKLILGVCELTNLPFDLLPTKTSYNNAYAPSLDRINSKDPNYSPENTRVVLASVNRALNEHGDKYLLPILKAMIQGIEKHG